MKHNIRINGEVKTIDCELGSGIFDKNGREIFEGDKVNDLQYGNYGVVYFGQGALRFPNGNPLSTSAPKAIEIIGHPNCTR